MPLERSRARLDAIGPIFRSGEAVDVGVAWRDLYALRDAGEIVEISRGVYLLASAGGVDNVDFIAVTARSPGCMVCLNSALAYWDLSDAIPATVHIAVPTGMHRPAIDYPPTSVHVFAAPSFSVGRVEVVHDKRQRFWITSRERSVVDAFRLRHLIGESVAHDAMRRYLHGSTDLPLLMRIGRDLNAGARFADSLRLLLG